MSRKKQVSNCSLSGKQETASGRLPPMRRAFPNLRAGVHACNRACVLGFSTPARLHAYTPAHEYEVMDDGLEPLHGEGAGSIASSP
jgi:hypothetical protein